MRIVKRCVLIAVISFLVLFIVTFPFSYLILGSYIDYLFEPCPPEPAVKYGEFPFQLKYEINGKEIAVEDTVVVEFDGFKRTGQIGGTRRRLWKSYLKNNNAEWYSNNTDVQPFSEVEVVLMKIDEKTRVCFLLGSSSYYMNDPASSTDEKDQEFYRFPEANYSINKIDYDGNEILYRPRVGVNELWEKYKIKLLSWEHSEPIKNEFIE